MDDDRAEECMAATYRALCAEGYADLTMQAIADETDRSKATLHYHYETKADLLVAFLDYLYERFTDRVADPPGETPAERLLAFVDAVLTPPNPDDNDPEAFGVAVLEMMAQAPYDPAVRDRLEAFDEFLHDRVREFVVAGVEAGQFRPVDPDDTARFLVTAIDGARAKQVAVGQDLACTRRTIREYVETHLMVDAPAGDGPTDPNPGTNEDDGTDPDTNTGTDPDTNTGTDPDTNTGTDPDTNTNTDTDTDTDADEDVVPQ